MQTENWLVTDIWSLSWQSNYSALIGLNYYKQHNIIHRDFTAVSQSFILHLSLTSSLALFYIYSPCYPTFLCIPVAVAQSKCYFSHDPTEHFARSSSHTCYLLKKFLTKYTHSHTHTHIKKKRKRYIHMQVCKLWKKNLC